MTLRELKAALLLGEAEVREGLSTKEQARLITLLQRVVANLEARR